MSAAVTTSTASHLTCEWCGLRRPRPAFQGTSGRRYSRCMTCRYEATTSPPPTDPVRKRECWKCERTFTTRDFTQRLCSPDCRTRYRKSSTSEILTVEDEKKIARVVKRIGVPKGDL